MHCSRLYRGIIRAVKRRQRKLLRKLLFGVCVILAFSLFVLVFAKDASAPSTQDESDVNSQADSQASSFDKMTHSLTEPSSIWVVVNKIRPISPLSYAPTDLVTSKIPLASSSTNSSRLRQEPAAALQEMAAGAQAVGFKIMHVSGYRSYQYQVSVYNGYVQQYGQAGADKVSARPGTSEHQTGLAVDIGATNRKCELETCFADTPEGKWLAANAHTFGFILRYPEGKTEVTGYSFEPWHFRYVGKELAAEMNKQGIQTLEEFFGIVPDKQPY